MMPHEPRVLLDGLAYVGSPRWHDGRLWFSHWGGEEVLAVDLAGNSEVVAAGRPGMGWATAWLPDGRLLVTYSAHSAGDIHFCRGSSAHGKTRASLGRRSVGADHDPHRRLGRIGP
jgi:hypothetical protein